MWKKVKIIIFSILGIGAIVLGGSSLPTTNDVSIESLATKYQSATEIKAEYSLNNASLIKTEVKNQELDKYTGEFKDEVKVEIGEVKTISTPILGGLLGAKDEQVIEPSISLSRWNETNFKLKPILDAKVSDRKMSFDKNKILFETPKMNFEIYSITENEGGVKYIWFLNERPESNIVSFQFDSSGLDFFYQPPLTQEFKNGYSEEFKKEIIVSETQVKDLEGNVLVNRPENVVGSYAVYHSTKGGMNDVYGKDYKTGQAFFIYPSHLTDAEGKTSKAILKIENGVLSEEIPQEFLDKAVYPIRGNATFGYTTAGGSSYTDTSNTADSSQFSAPADGTIYSIKVYAKDSGDNIKGLIFTHADLKLIANGIGQAVALGTSADWKESLFSTPPTVISGTSYLLGFTPNATITYYFNSGATNTEHYDSTNSYTTPQDMGTAVSYDSILSIYATYTEGGGGGTAPIPQIIIID